MSAQRTPGAMSPATGADGSVGGLGTRDSINSGPMQAGLIKREPREAPISSTQPQTPLPDDEAPQPKVEVEDEDARARRLLLESLSSDGTDANQPTIDAISSLGNDWMLARTPQNETEAYQLDIQTRPESASLDDYERVPIEQFGAAMLRGMGWSAKANSNIEPYLPSQRPALLGIGAKERPAEDIPLAPGVKVKKKGRPDMKYMPLVKKERETASGSSSRVSSRSASPTRATSRRSPSPGTSRSRRKDYDDRDRSSYDSDSRRDRDRDRRKDRDYDDRRDRDSDRGRDDRRSDKDDRRSDRDRDSRRDRDDSRRGRDDRDRGRDSDRSSRRDRRD
ncbi:hypothetical protein EXIGLDRAFT_3781 [Exidia glandulosa HHB12029]|uniref:Spp2/MOS2 G-patch domain-containing protein n=1 Tax=Exidia glandulosa HHB12029 TaxID=1314781 RepID=A0A166BT42_EXIGL|nr:hypothetical protein EXIGLDRAFT_3781 [Exidia glandulosa HHB12029]